MHQRRTYHVICAFCILMQALLLQDLPTMIRVVPIGKITIDGPMLEQSLLHLLPHAMD